MQLVANLANKKRHKIPEKITETLAHGYLSEITQRELSNKYNMTGLDAFQKSLRPCSFDKSSLKLWKGYGRSQHFTNNITKLGSFKTQFNAQLYF